MGFATRLAAAGVLAALLGVAVQASAGDAAIDGLTRPQPAVTAPVDLTPPRIVDADATVAPPSLQSQVQPSVRPQMAAPVAPRLESPADSSAVPSAQTAQRLAPAAGIARGARPAASAGQGAAAVDVPVRVPATPDSPAAEAPTSSVPAGGAATAGAPAAGAPTAEVQASDAPASGAPASGAPKAEAPSNEATTTEAPKAQTPKAEVPAAGAPAVQAPAAAAPAAEAPGAGAPASVSAAAAVEQIGLIEAYRLARDFDPTFRAARHELEAGLQALPIARAAMRPNISASAALTRSAGERQVPSLLGGSTTSDLDYTSRQLSLSLRQPLYNRELGVRFNQAESQVEYARAQFAVREHELAVRLAQAYFDLLFALDVIELAQAQVDAYSEQVQLARRRFQLGEGTRTEVADAEARRALARADLIDAAGRRLVALETLTSITGPLPAPVANLRLGWMPPPLVPETLTQWLDLARENSPQIQAQRYAVEYVTREVQRVRSGHYPRVDLVASLNSSKSDTINTVDQTVRQNLIGLQLSVPIYAGGGVGAQTDQALANLAKEESRLEATTSAVLLEVRRQHLTTTNAWARIAAYESAVTSSEVALRGAEIGVRAGLRVQSDVLDAQRLWYVSRRDLARARYQYLVARLSLQAAAGTISETDVAAVDAFLAR